MGIELRSAVGALFIGVLALAGDPDEAGDHEEEDDDDEQPAKVTLVVYPAQGYDKVMTAAFQKATGIPVKFDDNSTGPLLTQIEASKNNPFADTRATRGRPSGLRLEPGG
jgi:ABC-type molybdate transport system substrate-binding protein